MSVAVDYLRQREKRINENIQNVQEEGYQSFNELVKDVDNYLLEIQKKEVGKDWNTVQYKALIGDKDGEHEYLTLIEKYVEKNKKKYVAFPKWYSSLEEGLFHETIGLAGIAEWLNMEDSSTCKVIQPRVYFREKGTLVEKPQKISKERFKRLVNTLCQSDYNKRANDDIIEMVIRDNIRVTIYQNVNKKSSEGTIIFRKYTVQNQAKNNQYKFEQLADKGAFSHEAGPLLEAIVECRFNINIIGAPFTGKTTLLSYYSAYEDQNLEGITIQNEAEFDSTQLLPNAPVIDFLINDENRESTKSAILRSDLEYLTYGEVRRGDELDLLLFLTTKGITGVKGTYHTAYSPEDFPYLVADQVQKATGAELYPTMLNAAKSFDFLFEMINHPFEKDKKLLKGIYELCIDPDTLLIYSNAICLYNFHEKRWQYNNQLSQDTIQKASDNNYQGYKRFEAVLNQLAEKYPLPEEKQKRVSVYSRLIPRY